MPSQGHSLCNMALFTCRFNWLNGVLLALWLYFEQALWNYVLLTTGLKTAFCPSAIQSLKMAESFYSLVFAFLSMPSCWFVYIYDCGCIPQIISVHPLEPVSGWKGFIFRGSLCCCWQQHLNSWTALSKIHFLILYLDRNMFFQDWSSISYSYNLTTVTYLSHSCFIICTNPSNLFSWSPGSHVTVDFRSSTSSVYVNILFINATSLLLCSNLVRSTHLQWCRDIITGKWHQLPLHQGLKGL